MRTKHWENHRWQGEPVSVVGAVKIVSIPNEDHTAAVIAARRKAGIGEQFKVAA